MILNFFQISVSCSLFNLTNKRRLKSATLKSEESKRSRRFAVAHLARVACMETVSIARTKLSLPGGSQTWWVREEKEVDNKGEKTPVKVTVKKSVQATQQDLIELFHSYVKRFEMHHFSIKQQQAF